MTICKAAAARLALESQISKPTFNLLHTVVVFMQSVWYPVREYLAPVEERPKDRYQIWIPVAALWDELGFACGLSLSDPDIEDPEPWSEQILNLGDERFSRVGCSWPDCLCSLSPHHGMKICKGCWQARYCSRECQEMYVLRRHVGRFGNYSVILHIVGTGALAAIERNVLETDENDFPVNLLARTRLCLLFSG